MKLNCQMTAITIKYQAIMMEEMLNLISLIYEMKEGRIVAWIPHIMVSFQSEDGYIFSYTTHLNQLCYLPFIKSIG